MRRIAQRIADWIQREQQLRSVRAWGVLVILVGIFVAMPAAYGADGSVIGYALAGGMIVGGLWLPLGAGSGYRVTPFGTRLATLPVFARRGSAAWAQDQPAAQPSSTS